MKSLYPLFIGGTWEQSNEVMDVINPYNNQSIAKVCRALPEHAERALHAAHKARPVMASLPSHQKAEILHKVAESIRVNREEFARTITLETGKPVQESRNEVDRAALTFRIASEETSHIGGDFISLDRNKLSEGRWGITRRFPCGPVFGITPFNFPLNLVVHKIAPAIAAGNPVLLKPASKTPASALMLAEIIQDSGIPEGCLSVLPCGSTIAEKIIADERIKVLSFTGSAPVGWQLKKLANEKKVILELGGNAGVVIDRECDLEYAIARCVTGSFSYAGQVCISVQRIYTHRDIFDNFIETFTQKVKELKMGDPLDDANQVGPMIDEENLARVESWVNEAKAAGAKVITGGKRENTFYEPTILLDTTPKMKVSCMEVFAPVVTVTKIDDLKDGLDAVNESIYGLQAGVFTNNLKNAFLAFEVLEVGGVIINDVPAYRVDHMPYGGVKMSGFGREGLKYAIEEMTDLRLMALNVR
ncbi:MAG TPA: aldehyde dehydrogenase family protein [Thermodesulfovibrionales bacterium]|nr:aldehyde dehydrogenase family protein [Thermodesulfovibrionales bacterium]